MQCVANHLRDVQIGGARSRVLRIFPGDWRRLRKNPPENTQGEWHPELLHVKSKLLEANFQSTGPNEPSSIRAHDESKPKPSNFCRSISSRLEQASESSNPFSVENYPLSRAVESSSRFAIFRIWVDIEIKEPQRNVKSNLFHTWALRVLEEQTFPQMASNSIRYSAYPELPITTNSSYNEPDR